MYDRPRVSVPEAAAPACDAAVHAPDRAAQALSTSTPGPEASYAISRPARRSTTAIWDEGTPL